MTNDTASRRERGEQTLRGIDGDEGLAVVARLRDISPGLAEAITDWAFGDVYCRPGLSPRDRQLVTLGALTALGGCEPQLRVHVGASLNVGLTRDEVLEALLHAAVYCGIPRSINATLVAQAVFDTRDDLAHTC